MEAPPVEPGVGRWGEAVRGGAGQPEPEPPPRCDGGLVHKGATECGRCVTDSECRGTCTLETGRCSAAGSCRSPDECLVGQACDGGFCVHDERSAGECGVGAVFFGWDTAEIPASARRRLLDGAACITRLRKQIVIETHADNVGSEEFNILLAERRGQAIRKLLIDAAVPADRLVVVAKGSLEAIGVDESTRAKDRRALLLIVQ